MYIYFIIDRIYLDIIYRVIALSEHENFYMIIIQNPKDRNLDSICGIHHIDHILVQFMIYKHDDYIFNSIATILSGKGYISFSISFCFEIKSSIGERFDICILSKEIFKQTEIISSDILQCIIKILFILSISVMIKIKSTDQRSYYIIP